MMSSISVNSSSSSSSSGLFVENAEALGLDLKEVECGVLSHAHYDHGNGMEQFFVFENAFNKDYIEVLDLYVYNTAMDGGYSLSTAISILKSVISVVLLWGTNKFSKAVRGEGFI